MPISTPNRVAHPVSLESYVPPIVLRQESSLFVDYYNDGANTIIAGEPVRFLNRVGYAQRTILPGKMGVLLFDWIGDAILEVGHTGNILQDALVYWDLDEDAVTPVEGGDAVAGIGAASASVPTNGFILGRAVGVHQTEPSVSGANKLICAQTGSLRVRVVAASSYTGYGSAS